MLAILPSAKERRLRVVSEISDSGIAVVDFGEDDRRIYYEKNRVVGIEA
jgi:hypothetical protein